MNDTIKHQSNHDPLTPPTASGDGSSSSSSSSSSSLIIPENAKSVSYRDLPPLDPQHQNNHTCTILLFYQYIEPQWTKSQHKQALKKVIDIGHTNHITGRGRVAQEGLNCTLTGRPKDIRSFCTELRRWNEVFYETDFKLTDGVPMGKMFKSLSIRKTDELVAYGLEGDKAPSLKQFAGTHLEADEYHKAMQDPETVIIDVRNAYESAIGSFQPPKGGAKLIDPRMRNSIEFPKWLNSKKTQDELNGKKVLMYCTGGIRCERATALLNQMSTVNENLKPKGVYHCRGGIERYVKTFPKGGFWKGKNYLFDRRMEQAPDIKGKDSVEEDVDSKCSLCRVKWTVYRGQYKCSRCNVPVIVCTSCTSTATAKPGILICELCREGYRAPSELPDLVGMKRKADEIFTQRSTSTDNTNASKRRIELVRKPKNYYNDRLFLKRVPLTANFQKIKDAIGEDKISALQWLTDKDNGGFYGSCVALMANAESKKQVLERRGGIRIGQKKIKLAEVFTTDNGDMFQKDFVQKEYPPIGNFKPNVF